MCVGSGCAAKAAGRTIGFVCLTNSKDYGYKPHIPVRKEQRKVFDAVRFHSHGAVGSTAVSLMAPSPYMTLCSQHTAAPVQVHYNNMVHLLLAS